MNYFIDYPFIKQDMKALSLSFNCQGYASWFNRRILEEMKRIARQQQSDLRISLHSSPDCDLHSMIILQHRNCYVRPHRHLNKAECYHLLEGTQTAFVFDAEGKVIRRCDMSLEDIFIFRFEKGLYHMTIPTSEFVIFHESKKGPFVRQGDSLFADWAPGPDDKGVVIKFLSSLLEKNTTP